MANKELQLHFEHVPWVRMNFLLQRANHEIGFFAISAEDDPLRVIDLYMPKQEVSAAFVKFDEDDISEYMDLMSQKEDSQGNPLSPANYWRIWIHTHPNMSPQPSGTDEETFSDTFGECSWAVMFIIAKNSQTFARLRCVSKHPLFGEIPQSHQLKVVYDPLQNLTEPVTYPVDEWIQDLKDKCHPFVYKATLTTGKHGMGFHHARGQDGFHGSRTKPGKSSSAKQLPPGSRTSEKGDGADPGATFLLEGQGDEEKGEGSQDGPGKASDVGSLIQLPDGTVLDETDVWDAELQALVSAYADVDLQSAVAINSCLEEYRTLTELEQSIFLREVVDDHGVEYVFDLLEDITKPPKETTPP
jgi:proteasome lid subunit RPN8/RPN11